MPLTPLTLLRVQRYSSSMAQPGATVFLDRVTARLRRGLEERLSHYVERGHSLDEIGSAEELADLMLRAVPTVSRWNDLLGPFYSASQVAKICGGISRQALADRRERRTILGLKTADGVIVYPTFQFDEKNRVLSGLSEVLQCFRDADVDDWTLAGWLVSPSRSLGGRSAVDWLRLGRELDPVLVLARDAARRFSE
jgi:hypothetical protein